MLIKSPTSTSSQVILSENLCVTSFCHCSFLCSKNVVCGCCAENNWEVSKTDQTTKTCAMIGYFKCKHAILFSFNYGLFFLLHLPPSQALGMLFWHKHNIEKSLADLPNFTPFPDEWTVEDKVLFEQAFSFHGKTFHRIQQMVRIVKCMRLQVERSWLKNKWGS